jgi:hypothetical protein
MEQLPAEAQRVLNEIAHENKSTTVKKRIFVAIPNMCQVNVGLMAKLFQFATQRKYDLWFHFETEKRHADYARNQCVKAFLGSECEFLLMIDHDVDPHPEILDMCLLNKDIVAGNVFCWIAGDLMSSIWERAECEQCRNLEIWVKEHKVHDASQYTEHDGYLRRWNPFLHRYQDYAYAGLLIEGQSCRCQGTRKDPFVFRTHQSLPPDGKPLQVDSVGSAAMMIHRRVIEKMPFPWFRFLYKESGEILLTEDHYFCWKAQACGMEVWADPHLFCSHYKLVDLLQLGHTLEKIFKLGIERTKVAQSIEVPKEEVLVK